MNEELILLKARQIAGIIKQHEDYIKDKRVDLHKHPEMKYPEFYEGYRTIASEYDSILVHSMKGTFPEHLFQMRAPNMEEKEFQYIKSNYKQITLPLFMDFTNSVYRSFNDGNWSVDLEESHKEGDDSFVEYIEKDISVYRSLETWMKNILIPCKLRDAMGVIAIKPNYFYKESEENPDEYELDDTKMAEPIPVYYTCKQVVSPRHEKYYQILLTEKSIVTFNNQKQKEGLIFEFYIDEYIYRVEQYGKKNDLLFAVTSVEATGVDYPSVVCLMGTPMITEDKVTYQSPFLYAVDNLDLVVLTQSYLQSSEAKCVYPYRVMIGNECNFSQGDTRCVDGRLWRGNNVLDGVCPTCKGSGTKTRISPLGEMLIRPDEGKEIDIDKALKYVSPETHTLDFLIKEIDRNYATAREILHLGKSESQAQGSGEQETASGKWIDQKSHYAFIKPISDQCFYIYEFVLNTIGRMRYENFEDVVVNAPISFEFNTQEDYIEQMKSARDSGMPDFVFFTIMYKFLSSLFYTENKTMQVFTLIQNADRLILLSNSDIVSRVSAGTVEPWEEYLHTSIIQLISELEREDEKFFDKELKDQIEALQTLAKNKVPKVEKVKSEPVNLFN